MSAKPPVSDPVLTDSQIAVLFDAAGLAIPENLRDRVWADVRSLKAGAALLRGPANGIPAVQDRTG